MKDWRTWVIILLVGVMIYLWITRPKPKVDERVKVYEKVIQDQQVIIDSLRSVMELESVEFDKQKEQFDKATKVFQQTISRQRQQLQENETIHELPTPELDSIVRELYGEGAI